MAALAIDLTALYVAQNEAQRAADAAALAGARELARWGGPFCDSSLLDPGSKARALTLAKQRAVTVGKTNVVSGQFASIVEADIDIPSELGIETTSGGFADKKNPSVRATVRRMGTPADPITIFARYWGISGSVSAEAIAEAYADPRVKPPIPDPVRPRVGTLCVKPWLLPNCNPTEICSPQGFGQDGYFDVRSGALHMGLRGQAITMTPAANSPPPLRQFLPVTLPGDTATGALAYEKAIRGCHPTPLFPIQEISLSSPVSGIAAITRDSVSSLIQRHDTLDRSTVPFRIISGQSGQFMSYSDSVVTVPVYNQPPTGTSYRIFGFLQLFIESVDSTGQISARIVGATSPVPPSGLIYKPDQKSLVADGTMMCPGVEARLVRP
jgi:hypothetical protein